MKIKPKKSLGQNFLIDKNIIDKICNIIDIKASPSPDNNSLEISLIFSVINTDEAEELSLVLERVR